MIVDIAEAVKDVLNAAELSEEFTVERHYTPHFELKDMKDLRVTVVPSGITSTTMGRNRAQHDVDIDVAVQQKYTAGDNTELDALMTLVEEIAALFRRQRLTDYNDAIWVKGKNEPIFAQEHMDELRQFTSVLTLTFRVMK
jgi:hypothetical protein